MAAQRFGYTQNMEEKYIVAALPASGRFLDIGAHDGITFSSTRALLEKGWTGVYVEPEPLALAQLEVNTSNFSQKVAIYPIAIGEADGSQTFYSANGDMIGTLSPQHRDLWSSAVAFTETKVQVQTLETLARQVGYNFDFINLDVEGLNWMVFQQFDWHKWRPRCVCIEYENKFNEIKGVLERHGYQIVYVSTENIVAVKK